MSNWRPQHHRKLGQSVGAASEALAISEKIGREIIAIDPRLTPVFTLRHLAALADVDYSYLRSVISRSHEDPYRVFTIRKSKIGKKEDNFRVICVPEPDLMRLQRWISKNILAYGRPHWASYAYAPGSSIKEAAALHCKSSWLIKLDVQRFFESISELAVYHTFLSLGYRPLIAFEMARLCTRVGRPMRRSRWLSNPGARNAIPQYYQSQMGHLPQGAPTSPMLSNLAMTNFDHNVSLFAEYRQLIYTRYADDIALSSSDSSFRRAHAAEVIKELYSIMQRSGLSPNRTKSHVLPPGTRKIILGLLVNERSPRLTRQFRSNLRQHIYYLLHPDIGPTNHAQRRGFVSVRGLRSHLDGLVRFAKSIDRDFAEKCQNQLAKVAWPS